MEMGDGDREFGVCREAPYGPGPEELGGTGQHTGGGIQNSLIGKAVVALNDMFGREFKPATP
jgi:hypothetical protein